MTEIKLKALDPASVLGKIVAAKIEDVARRSATADRFALSARTLNAVTAGAQTLAAGAAGAHGRPPQVEDFRPGLQLPPSDRSFERALREAARKPALIAEVKRRSPSRGPLREHLDVDEVARVYDAHAAVISVVTDGPFFGGTLELLADVRRRVRRPVMLKDFVVSEHQIFEARAAGADAALLMASVLEAPSIEHLLGVLRGLGMEALVEVHTEAELDAVLGQTSARVIGVNNRDLGTLAIDLDNFPRLAGRVRERGLVTVAESGFSAPRDVERVRGLADAVLIGSTFMAAASIEAKVVELGW